MQKQPFSIELSDEAEYDFDQSFEYYSAESKVLADRFYNQINSSFERICSNPLASSKVLQNLHRYTVTKFPFVIYFQVTETTVRVIAIFHTSRNPQIWNDRID